jgi:hypothetical protein
MRVKFISLQCLCTQIYDNLGAILSVQYHIWDIKICNLSSINQISFLCLSWICTPYTWFATYISIVALLIPNLLSLVVYGHGSNLFYYTLYVNDIVLTISTLSLLQIIGAPTTEFFMKDIGTLHHAGCLDNLFLSQHRYMFEILKPAGMSVCRMVETYLDIGNDCYASSPLV